MFENLTNKFEGILDTFKKAPSLNEKQVDEGLKLIRQALLEADVSLEVVKDFVTKVKPKLLGKEIIRSTAPGQMVVKICLLYTSPSPRDKRQSRMPSSA